MSQAKKCMRSSQKYHKTHNQEFSISTHLRWSLPATIRSSQVFRTHTTRRIVGDYRRVASMYRCPYAYKESDFAATNRHGMRRYDFQLRERSQTRSTRWREWRNGSNYGYDISRLPKMQKKHSSGCTSDILQRSRLRTSCNERRTCVYIPRYLYSERSGKTEHSQRRGTGACWPHRNEIPYGKSQDRILTISYSPVTRMGNTRSCSKGLTDVTWSQRQTTVSFRHWSTWTSPEQTLLCFTHQSFRRTSVNLLRRSRSRQLCTVRKRWCHESRMGRWLFHLLLCICDRDRKRVQFFGARANLAKFSFTRSTVVWWEDSSR